MKNRLSLFFYTIVFLVGGCDGQKKEKVSAASENAAPVKSSTSAGLQASPFEYDLSRPDKSWVLPSQLKEISGNTWVDKDHLLAIEDLHPNLYLIRLGQRPVIEKQIAFLPEKNKKMDIEDVVLYNNTVYALWSHGTIFKIRDWQQAPQVQKIKTFLKKENNTEGICLDPVTNDLLVVCKNEANTEDEEKKSTRAVYEFDLKGDSLKTQPFLYIYKKQFKKITGNPMEFYPSAIAVHPVTHDLYILSTRGTKCLAIFTHKGELKSVQLIDKDLLPQPEGICFSPEGIMYVSSEGKKGNALINQYKAINKHK
jgi:SdiA-regulated